MSVEGVALTTTDMPIAARWSNLRVQLGFQFLELTTRSLKSKLKNKKRTIYASKFFSLKIMWDIKFGVTFNIPSFMFYVAPLWQLMPLTLWESLLLNFWLLSLLLLSEYYIALLLSMIPFLFAQVNRLISRSTSQRSLPTTRRSPLTSWQDSKHITIISPESYHHLVEENSHTSKGAFNIKSPSWTSIFPPIIGYKSRCGSYKYR